MKTAPFTSAVFLGFSAAEVENDLGENLDCGEKVLYRNVFVRAVKICNDTRHRRAEGNAARHVVTVGRPAGSDALAFPSGIHLVVPQERLHEFGIRRRVVGRDHIPVQLVSQGLHLPVHRVKTALAGRADRRTAVKSSAQPVLVQLQYGKSQGQRHGNLVLRRDADRF